MGVACQILIDKAKDGVHKAGEKVTGTVKYALDKPTELKALTLSLLGTGKCTWTESSSNNSSTSYYGTKALVRVHINLLNKKQDSVTLNIGSYEYPFMFHLPEDLPTSYKNNICTIAYKIQLKFEKSDFFSINKTFSTDIPVYGVVIPTSQEPIIFGLEKTLFTLLSFEKPVINLKAEISKTTLTPGENAHLSIVVSNNTDEIPAIRSELWCFIEYTADCGRKNSHTTKVMDCIFETKGIPVRSVTNLLHTIPTAPNAYTIISKVMKLEYKLRVTVRLPVPHINASVDMPVVIGETREMQVSVEDASCSFAGGTNAEEPPSYWEAMNEDEDKST